MSGHFTWPDVVALAIIAVVVQGWLYLARRDRGDD